MNEPLVVEQESSSMVNIGLQGSSGSNWVVQKFGGTSVGKFALNIIDQVVL